MKNRHDGALHLDGGGDATLCGLPISNELIGTNLFWWGSIDACWSCYQELDRKRRVGEERAQGDD